MYEHKLSLHDSALRTKTGVLQHTAIHSSSAPVSLDGWHTLLPHSYTKAKLHLTGYINTTLDSLWFTVISQPCTDRPARREAHTHTDSLTPGGGGVPAIYHKQASTTPKKRFHTTNHRDRRITCKQSRQHRQNRWTPSVCRRTTTTCTSNSTCTSSCRCCCHRRRSSSGSQPAASHSVLGPRLPLTRLAAEHSHLAAGAGLADHSSLTRPRHVDTGWVPTPNRPWRQPCKHQLWTQHLTLYHGTHA